MAKEKKYRPRKSSVDIFINTVLTVVIIAVLGLSVYAVGGKISTKIAENEQAANEAAGDTYTVQNAADEKGLSVDDFLAQYGLTDVAADDLMSSAVEKMTCGNYAKYNDQTFEDFAATNKLPDTVTEDTPWSEAQDLIPISVTLGGDEAFEQMKQMIGLDDSITKDTPTGEAMPVVQQKYSEYLEAQQAAQTAAPAASEDAAATEEAGGETAEASQSPAPSESAE